MNALLLLLLLAQTPDKVAFTEDSTGKTVKPGDFANKAVRVNCVTGCSAGGSSGGKVLDGTASGEADVLGSAPAGTEQALVTRNIPSGTQPVSGTFWQATQPVSGTFWQTTQPVSATSLPLPTGAATSAKQPALGTAGTPSADVLTVQGVTSMTALKVDGSAVTQPVSGPLTDTQIRATALPVSGTFWPATQPVSGTVTANAGTGTMAVSGTFWQATQPVSGTVTANAGSGTMAVSGPLTDTQIRATALPVSGTFFQATQPISAAALPLPSGAATSAKQPALGTAGTASADVLTVQGAASMTALKVDGSAATQPVSGTVTANAGTNLNTSALALDATLTGGTAKARVSGNAGAALDAANNAAMPANAIAVGVQTGTIDTTPTAATAGNLRYQLASTEGVLYVQEGGPKRFSCILNAVTVLTQCQAAPAAGLRAYVTSVTLSNQAATVQTLDVVYGTGSNCATAAAAITHKVQFGTNATTTSPQSYGMSFPTPLVPVAANAICVRPSAATAFGATITGYVAP
jgi:hypothetical protein